MPLDDASQCVEATAPKVPRSSGRVVKLMRVNSDASISFGAG